MQILISTLVLGVMGFIFGAALSYASKKFEVKTDERFNETLKLLPGANCGSCGFAGCSALAKAIVEGTAKPSACSAISSENCKKINELLGIESSADAENKVKKTAFIKCQGDCSKEYEKFEYTGVKDCQAAVLVQNGPWLCPFRCLGFGSCVAECPFGAITMGQNKIPTVNSEKCVGCGKCALACPKQLIEIVDVNKTVRVKCNSSDAAAAVVKVCKTGCIGCKLCEKICTAGAIKVENNIAKIDYEKCTLCKACVEKCPRHAIIIQEKP